VSTHATLDRVETQRLVCERLRMDHLDDVSRLLGDPRVGRWMWHRPDAPPTEREIVEGLADKIDHWERYGFGLWLLRDRVTDEAIGRGGLQWTYAVDLHEVEAAWAIVPERWGEGLATELALASIETAFGPLGLDEVIAFTLPDNLRSRRVMEKAAFAYQRDIVHGGLPHVLYRRRRC
jgi:[ribosomal protein S5]-alanine N-acetyltransferase